MSRRFFCADLPENRQIELTGGEAKHLALVLRGQPGDQITLFDGRGHSTIAVINEIRETSVVLTTGAIQIEQHKSRPQVTLATAVPKGDRFDWLIEKATELGVTRVIPLMTKHSVVEPRETKLERLRRVVLEASKQCRRNDLMQIAELTTWQQLLAVKPPSKDAWILDPQGESWNGSRSELEQDLLFVVGPEGGLTESERQSAKMAGFKELSLGPTILRIETAAIAIASVVLCQ